MLKQIKQISAVLLVLFLLVSLFILIFVIWDFINNELAKEAFQKTALTFGAIYIISLLVITITKSKQVEIKKQEKE